MSLDRQAERDAIQAAAARLLAGTPIRSTGALTVLQLAAEAGVKRWVLTHKHPDLREEFEQQRQAANGVPAAYQHLQGRIADLEAVNHRLRNENTELTERVDTYALVIRELTIAVETLRAQHRQGSVIHLPVRSPPIQR